MLLLSDVKDILLSDDIWVSMTRCPSAENSIRAWVGGGIKWALAWEVFRSGWKVECNIMTETAFFAPGAFVSEEGDA